MTHKTAKLFTNGGSQAVRLPAEFRFEGDEVYIRRDPRTGNVILSARPELSWVEFMALRHQLGELPDDALADRAQGTEVGVPVAPERDVLPERRRVLLRVPLRDPRARLPQHGDRAAPLVLSVLESRSAFDRELAIFARTLWTWLGGAALLLLLAQLLLLRWGLAPLRRVAHEIRRIEGGRQERVEGEYPAELSRLTDNLNALLREERVRQTRYKEALSYLAHSLKTPLAVLRGALAEPQRLPDAVDQQVRRMDDIVQHQLARAMAGGAPRFAPPLPVAPVLARTREALAKVHAGKGLVFSIHCPPDLAWRIDEGGRRIVFQLRPDLAFSDGTPLRARWAARMSSFSMKSLRSYSLPARYSKAWICDTVRLTPHFEPISPQCTMKRSDTGFSFMAAS